MGRAGSIRASRRLEILGVVMGEDVLLGTAAADSFDHRGVIRRVGEDDAIGQPRRERAEGRPVRHIARGEQQRRLLAVQLGELAFEAARDSGWCRRCCGCRRRRRRNGRALRASPRSQPGAGPCRDSRSSTTPSPCGAGRHGENRRAGRRRRAVRGRQTPGSCQRGADRRAARGKTLRSSSPSPIAGVPGAQFCGLGSQAIPSIMLRLRLTVCDPDHKAGVSQDYPNLARVGDIQVSRAPRPPISDRRFRAMPGGPGGRGRRPRYG